LLKADGLRITGIMSNNNRSNCH